MSPENPGFNPEEAKVATPEHAATDAVEADRELPIKVGVLAQYATPSGSFSKPMEVVRIEHRTHRVGSPNRKDYQDDVYVHFKDHNVAPLIEIVSLANVEKDPEKDPKTAVPDVVVEPQDELQPQAAKTEQAVVPDASAVEVTAIPNTRTDSEDVPNPAVEQQAAVPVVEPEPIIGDFVRSTHENIPHQEEPVTHDVEEETESVPDKQSGVFGRMRDRASEIVDGVVDGAKRVGGEVAKTEFVSKIEARTVDSLKVWYQNYWFDKHDAASAQIDAKLKLATFEKEEMQKKQNAHDQMLKNMENLGAAAIVAAPEAAKERKDFEQKVKKLADRESALSKRLEARHEKRNAYEAERNRIADGVIQRLETLGKPHQDKVTEFESDRSHLALAIAEFETKIKENEMLEAALRLKIKNSEFKSERKAHNLILDEIGKRQRASRDELNDRTKALRDTDRSLRKAKAPLDTLGAIKKDFTDAKQHSRHEDRAGAVPQPQTSTVTKNTRMNPTAGTPDMQVIPGGVKNTETTRILEQRSLGDMMALWNRSFRNKQEIDAKGFNEYIKKSKLESSDVITIQQFAQVAQGYLNLKRSSDKTIRPQKKLAKDIKAFITINEYKYTA